MADDKPKVTRVQPQGADYSVLWTNGNQPSKGPEGASDGNADHVKDAVRQNGGRLSHTASTSHNEMEIWKEFDSGSFFNTHPQQTVQTALGMHQGQDIFMFDIETLGTFRPKKSDALNWFHPTEFAVTHATVGADKTLVHGSKSMSLLIQPTQDVFEHLHKLIGKVKSAGSLAPSLTADERRTLNDLLLYSAENPKNIFNTTIDSATGRKITELKRQLRTKQALDNTIFTPSHASRMERGLKNLMTHGTPIDTAVEHINQFFGGHSNFAIGGFNTSDFDVPAMINYLSGQVAKHNSNSTVTKALGTLAGTIKNSPNLDVLSLARTFFKNSYYTFGQTTRLEDIASIFGLNKGTSHMGIDDAKTTVDVFNQMLGKGMRSRLANGQANGLWNDSPVKVKDKLLSISGMRYDGVNSPFDAVYRRNENGVFELAHSVHGGAPLYNNTQYEVFGLYKDLDIGGKNHHGVMLENKDDGLFHFFARENLGDIQNIFQKHLKPYEGLEGAHGLGQKAALEDRALRRYNKLFSSDGTLLKRFMNGLDVLNTGASDADVLKAMQGTGWNGNIVNATDEQLRDLKTMKGRLNKEKDYINEFIRKVDSSPGLAGRDAYQARATAFRTFRNLMDEKFGQNVAPRQLSITQPVLPVTIGDELVNISMSHPERTKQSIRGIINRGHGSGARGLVKQARFTDLLGQLKAAGALTPYQANEYRRIIDSLDKDDDRFHNIIDSLTERLHLTTNARKYSMKAETVSGVVHSRFQAMQKGWAAEGQSIMDQAISHAGAYRSNTFDGEGMMRMMGGGFDDVLAIHDNAVKQIVKLTGVESANVAKPVSAKQTLSNLAKAYSHGDVSAALLFDNSKKSLVLALVNKEHAQQVFGLAPNKIIEDSRVATVKIPMINAEGSIALGTTARTARLKAVQEAGGKYQFVSGFEEVATQLMKMAPTARDLITKGKPLDAQGWMNSRVRETIQNLSMNNRHVDLRDPGKVLDSVDSKAAMYLRKGYLDVSEFAEQWYREEYVQRGTRIYDEASYGAWASKREKRANRLAEKAGSSYTSFVEHMSSEERQAFQFGVDGWLEQKFGVKTNMHSIKDTAVSQYLRSTTDARSLTPFGYYNPMARENLFKSVNYYPLDANHVRSQLTAAGKDSSSYMERRFVTDEAASVLGGETNYLNMRALHVDSKTLADKISVLQNMSEEELARLGITSDDLKSAGRLSTHEGTFLLRESISNAFSIARRQNIQLSNTSNLHDNIQQYIKDVHGEFDPAKNYEFGGNKRLSDLVGRKNGKITVGQLVREGKDPRAQDFYDGWNDDVFVKGWDADRRALVIEKREGVSNGTKFISDAGDRVTSVIVKDKVADYLMGEGVDVGLEPVNLKRRQFGTEAYKAINLAVDEIHRQEKLTPGRIALLEVLQGHVDEAFQTKGHTRIENGKLVIDHLFGFDGATSLNSERLTGFASKVNALLGKDLIGSNQAQIGLARANVHDWENGKGIVEGDRAGLVRYGLKEIDMIQARLDRHAASGTIGKESAVVGWVRDHVSQIGRNQGQMSEDIAHGYMRAAATASGIKTGGTDVVIRTRGDAFSYMGQDGLVVDKSGKEFAVMKNGVTEISHNAFGKLPYATMHDEKFTVGDYAKTALNMSGVDLGVVGKDGTAQGSFNEILKANRGTALYELPTQVAGRDYVRFIDTDLAQIGDMPVMTKLHKAQMSVWRSSQEYMGLKAHPEDSIDRAKAKKKLEESVLHYEDTIARTISSSRDSSLAKTFMSAQMDMSGRFRVQGINPFLSKKMGYEESTLYVSRDRMAEMIDGGEKNVAKTLGMDMERMKADFKKAGGGDFDAHLRSAVLDKVEENGLYGFVNRYPTINEDTVQVMKVAVDKTLRDVDRSGYMTVATSVRLKADYDGDFLSSVLSHYGHANGGEIHKELGLIHKADQEAMNGFTQEIHSSLQKSAAEQGVTVGDLWKNEKFRQEFGADIRARTSPLDNMESGFARLGKEHIGVIDNTRYKLLNMADATYDILHQADKMDARSLFMGRAKVQEFGRAFSQNLISSKKFSIDDIMKEVSAENLSQGELQDLAQRKLHERLDALEEMKSAVKAPDADGVERIKRANNILNVFEAKASKDQAFGLDDMLSEIQQIYRLNGNNKHWLDSRSMKFGVSEGQSMTTVGDLMKGGLEGEQVVMTPHIKNVVDILAQDASTAEMADTIRKASKQHQASVLNQFEGALGRPISNLDMATEATARASNEMLSGMTVAEKAQSKFADVMKNTIKKSPSGAIGFGAIMIAAAEMGDVWATGSLNRRHPTPEGTAQKDNPNLDTGGPTELRSIPGVNQQPTARVTQNNGEYMNIRINSKNASAMSHDQVASIVQNEINASMGAQVSFNMNVNDNTQNIDRQWIQDVVANAVTTGRVK